jgi:hypothetical protein
VKIAHGFMSTKQTRFQNMATKSRFVDICGAALWRTPRLKNASILSSRAQPCCGYPLLL